MSPEYLMRLRMIYTEALTTNKLDTALDARQELKSHIGAGNIKGQMPRQMSMDLLDKLN